MEQGVRIGRVAVDTAVQLDDIAVSLLASSPDAIVAIDATGRIVLANPSVEVLFGYEPDELVGSPLEVLLPGPLREMHVSHRERYAQHPNTRPMGAGLRLVGRRKDGQEIPIDVGLAPLAGDQGPLFAAFIRDATEQRRAERRLQAINDVSQDLLAGRPVSELLPIAARYARELAGALRAWVVMPGGEPGSVRVVAGDGPGADALVAGEYGGETFLGRSLAGGETVIDDYSSRDGDGPGHDVGIAVGPMLGVVMADAGRRFGSLVVARERDSAAFAPVEIAVVEAFAASSAVAFALADARSQLDRLAMVEERDRIARDLHDTVIQRLFATGMSLQGLVRLTTEPATGRLGQAVEELDETIREIRSAIFELQQPIGAPSVFRQRVQSLVKEAGDRLGSPVRLRIEGPLDSALDDVTANHLLAVLQEALSNVVRHAHAASAEVLIEVKGSEVCLVVADDGVGPPVGSGAGQGLPNMAARAEALGGGFSIDSRAGGGTRVEWRAGVHPPD
jgi:two-component system, NarL family, sensor histidine kinase DevS